MPAPPESILNCEAVHLHSQFLPFGHISYAVRFIGWNTYERWNGKCQKHPWCDLSPTHSPGPGTVAGHRTHSRETVISSRGQIVMPFVHNFEGAIVSTRLSENLLWKALTMAWLIPVLNSNVSDQHYYIWMIIVHSCSLMFKNPKTSSHCIPSALSRWDTGWQGQHAFLRAFLAQPVAHGGNTRGNGMWTSHAPSLQWKQYPPWLAWKGNLERFAM